VVRFEACEEPDAGDPSHCPDSALHCERDVTLLAERAWEQDEWVGCMGRLRGGWPVGTVGHGAEDRSSRTSKMFDTGGSTPIVGKLGTETREAVRRA
jgi:hypothetical protein